MDRLGLLRMSLAWMFAAPIPAHAEGVKVHRLAFLGSTSPSGYAKQLEAFRAGLRELGYVEGRNYVIEFRWAQGRYERLPALATELARSRPDVLVTHGVPGTLAAKKATDTIPIVVGVVGEAVGIGAVDALARPGGNITGSSFFVPEINAKRLEVLKEAFPRIARVGVLLNRENPVNGQVLRVMEQTAQALRIAIESVAAADAASLDDAIAKLVKARVGAVVVQDDAMLFAQVRRIADLATKNQMPTIGFVDYALAGGLLAFGVDFQALWRRAAGFVDKILKGAKPAALPVEQPTKFEVVVNLKTAKALGVTLPPSLLLRADHVIE